MGLKKGPWTAEEDMLLADFIRKNGHGNWRALPKQAGLLRCGKSCRLRWTNYLRPDIKRGNFSVQEEETIIKLHHRVGNRWSAIASSLPGRTDNEIKNMWNTHLKKRLLRMGIDPVMNRVIKPSSSVAQLNGYNLNSFRYDFPSVQDSDTSLYSSSTSLYTNAEFGGQPLSRLEPKTLAINSPSRQISNFSESFHDSPIEYFYSTVSVDNKTINTVDSSSPILPGIENDEVSVCLNSVDMDGLCSNQIHPAAVESEFNNEEFLVDDPFMWGDLWPALSLESNEMPRFQIKTDQVPSFRPIESMSVYREDDDLFNEQQNIMVNACTSTSLHHQL